MPSSFEKIYTQSKTVTGSLSLGNGVLDEEFNGYMFRNCEIRGGSLSCSNFKNCIFENVLFDGISLEAAVFIDCVFKGLTLRKCPIDMIRIERCSGNPPTILPS